MKTLCTLLILFLTFSASAQYDYEIGFWETGFWKKILKSGVSENGTFILNWENDEVRIKGEFKNGVPVQDWYFYSQDGILITTSNYNGQYVAYNSHNRYYYYFTDGNLRPSMIGEYTNGKPTGTWTSFYYRSQRDSVGIDSMLVHTVKDTSYQYSYLTNMTVNYANVYDDQYRITGERTETFTLGKHNYLEGLGKPQSQFSWGLSVGTEEIDISSLNAMMQSNLGEEFALTPILVSLDIFSGEEGGIHYGIQYIGGNFSKITSDSSSYNLMHNGGKFTLGYDLTKKALFDFIPYAGVSFRPLRISYTQESDVFPYSDSASMNTLFEDIRFVEPTNYSERQIDFKSNPVYLSFGAIFNVNIPISKDDKHKGLCLRANIGYDINPVIPKWKYTINGKDHEAPFIPTVRVNGLTYSAGVGYFRIF